MYQAESDMYDVRSRCSKEKDDSQENMADANQTNKLL